MARVRRKALSRAERAARAMARGARTRGGCAAKRDAVRGSEGGDAERHLCFSFVGRRAAPGESRATRREKRPSRRAKRRPTRRVRARGAVRAARSRCGQRAKRCALFYPARFMKNIWMMVEVCEFIRWTPSARTVSPTWDLGSQRHRRSLRTAREVHPTRRARMVVIHCKGKSKSTSSCTRPRWTSPCRSWSRSSSTSTIPGFGSSD